jgi:hypothetical protein
MADVPAWVLIINSLAAGGFGLAGTYLVPRSQREARRHEERRANAAIMREKAEQIFSEIARLEQEMGTQFVRTTSAVANGRDGGDEPLPDFDKIRALAAVYYPNLLTVLEALEAPMQERLRRATEALAVAADTKLDVREDAIRMVTFQMTLDQWQNVSKASHRLRAQLIEEVRPYLPNCDL